MAIDFEEFAAIKIPEGNVFQIKDEYSNYIFHENLEPGFYNANNQLVVSIEDSGINLTKNFSDKEGAATYYKTDQESGYCTFQRYPTATKIVLPEGIEEFGNNLLRECPMKVITIPSSYNPRAGNYSVGLVFSCKQIRKAYVKPGATTIGKSMFQGCSLLNSINLPNTILTIQMNGFYTSYYLPEITIPNSVTAIGDSAFRGVGSFIAGCTITMKSSTPPTLGINVFVNHSANFKIIVPHGSLSAYQNATNWSTWAEFMEEMPA